MKTDEISTETLAGIYEKQGYYRDALFHYTAVNRKNPAPSVEQAVQRVQGRVDDPDRESQRRSALSLAEQWFRLVLLRRRLKNAVENLRSFS
ncbi:MAG: hypothetical protein R6V41_07720 [Desulfobacteraceae bacterium]